MPPQSVFQKFEEIISAVMLNLSLGGVCVCVYEGVGGRGLPHMAL